MLNFNRGYLNMNEKEGGLTNSEFGGLFMSSANGQQEGIFLSGGPFQSLTRVPQSQESTI